MRYGLKVRKLTPKTNNRSPGSDLQNFDKFARKHLSPGLFLIKLQASTFTFFKELISLTNY